MRNKILLATAVVLMVQACSGIKVSSDYDPSVNFASLRDYSWLPAPPKPSGNPRIDNPLLITRIQRAIDRNLAARGYRKVADADADFFVTFHLGIDKKIDVTEIPSTYGYSGRWGGMYSTETRVDQYEEGTLLIDIVDAERDDLLWRGSGQARIRDSKSPAEREQRVQKAVDAILKKFPPQ